MLCNISWDFLLQKVYQNEHLKIFFNPVKDHYNIIIIHILGRGCKEKKTLNLDVKNNFVCLRHNTAQILGKESG